MTHHSTVLVLLAMLLLLLIPSSVAQHVNFSSCYEEKVIKLNNTNTEDTQQCFKYDITGKKRIETDRNYLSLSGCLVLCGHGYQLWPSMETESRLALFIFPLVILAGRVAWAPVGMANMFWTFVHLIGDPIDSLWSTLTRQEKARRNYHLGLELAPGASREVAAIWTTYDQWWQDPVEAFVREIKERKPLQLEATATDHAFPARALTAECMASRQVWIPDLLSHDEKYHIKKTAHELASNRTTHPIFSWIAIGGFLVSLALAYTRVATARNTNQTSHTLAVVMLFSFLLFAVYISGHVGNFREPEKVVRAINKLHHQCPKLFPAIEGRVVGEDLTGQSFSERYARVASWAGINNSWRPQKRLDTLNTSDRSQWYLFALSFFVPFVSWMAAFLLSYLTPFKGVGCRSASWTGIAFVWLLSLLYDTILGYWLIPDTEKRARRLWWLVVSKDLFVTVGSFSLVIVAQLGFFNTCWCMASMFFRKDESGVCIDLGAVTQKQRDQDWMMWLAFPIVGILLILAAIFIAGWEGEGGRLLFLRTDSERKAEDQALENMRHRLGIHEDAAWHRSISQQSSVAGTSRPAATPPPSRPPTRSPPPPPSIRGRSSYELDEITLHTPINRQHQRLDSSLSSRFLSQRLSTPPHVVTPTADSNSPSDPLIP